MRKLLCTTFLLTTTLTILGQTTNTFPADGNIGIGTLNPERKLEIKDGGILLNGLSPSVKLINRTPGISSWLDIAVAPNNGWYSKFAKKGSVVMRAVSSGGDFIISNPAGSNISFATGLWDWEGNPQKERMTITSTGDIGIGTKTPSGKLHVTGDTFIDGGWLRVTGQRGLFFQNYGGGFYMTDNSWIRTYGNKNFYHNTGIMRTDGHLQVGPGGNRFVVNTSGNVGIGMTNPDAKLAVNGNIHTKEVKVDLDGWADYVFKEDYQLPSLEEVAQHIKKKGHLINIPSAAEVEEKGVHLGEMNAKLLEKIEELTLYTIAQEKEIENQKSINQKQLDKNAALEARLAKIEALLDNSKR